MREAGLLPNERKAKTSDQAIAEAMIALAREVGGKIPSKRDWEWKRHQDASSPSRDVVFKWRNERERIEKLLAYCARKTGLDDIVQICKAALKTKTQRVGINPGNGQEETEGFIYVFESNGMYKIGMSNDVDRRLCQFQMPEPLNTVFRFRTDDPRGIEDYLHRRFAQKRHRGEYFRLDKSDLFMLKNFHVTPMKAAKNP